MNETHVREIGMICVVLGGVYLATLGVNYFRINQEREKLANNGINININYSNFFNPATNLFATFS